jgi:hypothetical protein
MASLFENERGLTGTTAGSVERAACPDHIPGELIPAGIKIRTSLKNARSSKDAP